MVQIILVSLSGHFSTALILLQAIQKKSSKVIVNDRDLYVIYLVNVTEVNFFNFLTRYVGLNMCFVF